MPARLSPKIENARKGSALLLDAAPQVLLRAFSEVDWTYLIGFSDLALKRDFEMPAVQVCNCVRACLLACVSACFDFLHVMWTAST